MAVKLVSNYNPILQDGQVRLHYQFDGQTVSGMEELGYNGLYIFSQDLDLMEEGLVSKDDENAVYSVNFELGRYGISATINSDILNMANTSLLLIDNAVSRIGSKELSDLEQRMSSKRSQIRLGERKQVVPEINPRLDEF